MEYYVKIILKTRDIYNIEDRVKEIQEIAEWLDELTEWKPKMYSLNVRHVSTIAVLDLFFVEEKHAMMCTLRWT
jgi:3-polyprenyl-4-hydroxybenzoate decarboxylase